MRSLFILILGVMCYGCECGVQELCNYAGPYARSSTGSIAGKYIKVLDTRVAAFWGIPYAIPPLGEKRFMRPEPVAAWDGILQATKKPPPCMQYSTQVVSWIPTSKPSENCLFLNIWVPTKLSCDDLGELPVLVWIHGGGFFAGSSEMDIYDGSIMAASGNVIVVSMNYRLGVFGFLNFGINEANGNMGMYDQLLALEWVRENIQTFGGDASRITLFGESAGSISTSFHILSPLSKNLFQRAIMQSGSSYIPYFLENDEAAYSKAKSYARLVGCDIFNENVEFNVVQAVQCLKKKDAMDLALADSTLASPISAFFLPTSGNEFMPKSVTEALKAGDFNHVDLLIGANSDEGTIIFSAIMPEIFRLDQTPKLNLTAAEMIIHKMFETIPSLTHKIFEFYFSNLTNEDTEAIVRNISSSYGDYIMACPTMYFAEEMRNAYMYWVTHRSLKNPFAEWVGVTHFDEIPYVFGHPILDSHKYTLEDRKFSESLIRKWASFARHGHPLQKEDNRSWSRFSAEHPFSFELSTSNQIERPYPRLAACEFWRSHFASAVK